MSNLPRLIEELPDAIKERLPEAVKTLHLRHFLDVAYFAPNILVSPVVYRPKDLESRRQKKTAYGINYQAWDDKRQIYYFEPIAVEKERSDQARETNEAKIKATAERRLQYVEKALGSESRSFNLVIGGQEIKPEVREELALLAGFD